jgi:hypothetical protein
LRMELLFCKPMKRNDHNRFHVNLRIGRL